MLNNHLISFAQQNIVTEIEFPLRNHLKGIPVYMKNGGQIAVDMQVFCERGMRAKLEPGTVLSWVMGEVIFDVTQLGRYSQCFAQVCNNKTGEVATWPFTMLYINEE